jgi:addiction module HigA family antidote
VNRPGKTVSEWRIHPGEILREEFLKPLHITSYELARQLRVPAPRVNDIVLEKRGITADTAVRLARFFGTTEQFWMNLQSSYEVRLAKSHLGNALRQIRPRRTSKAA